MNGPHFDERLAEASAKQDRYALASLSSFAGESWRHLLADDPEAWRGELDAAMAPWPNATRNFMFPKLEFLLSQRC